MSAGLPKVLTIFAVAIVVSAFVRPNRGVAQEREKGTDGPLLKSTELAAWIPARSQAVFSVHLKTMEWARDGAKSLDDLQSGLANFAIVSMRLPLREVLVAIHKAGAKHVLVSMWEFRPGVPEGRAQVNRCDGIIMMRMEGTRSLRELMRKLEMPGIRVVPDKSDSGLYELVKEEDRDARLWMSFPRSNVVVFGVDKANVAEVLKNSLTTEKRKGDFSSWPAWKAEIGESEFWGIRRDGLRLDGRTSFPSISFASAVDGKQISSTVICTSEEEAANFLEATPKVGAAASMDTIERILGVPFRSRDIRVGGRFASPRELTLEFPMVGEAEKDGYIFLAVSSNLGMTVAW